MGVYQDYISSIGAEIILPLEEGVLDPLVNAGSLGGSLTGSHSATVGGQATIVPAEAVCMSYPSQNVGVTVATSVTPFTFGTCSFWFNVPETGTDPLDSIIIATFKNTAIPAAVLTLAAGGTSVGFFIFDGSNYFPIPWSTWGFGAYTAGTDTFMCIRYDHSIPKLEVKLNNGNWASLTGTAFNNNVFDTLILNCDDGTGAGNCTLP